MSPGKQGLASYSPLFDGTVKNSPMVGRLGAARLRPEHTIEQAVKQKV